MILEHAQKLALEVQETIRPYCVAGHCEVAGSIRRQKPANIKDIEIVAIPDNRFLSELQGRVNFRWGAPEIGRFPSKYTRVRGVLNIDFFWCTPQTWGLNFFIRTGSAEFVKMALVRWKQLNGGGGYSEGARLWRNSKQVVETPTEMAVFEALGWTWVPPEKRG